MASSSQKLSFQKSLGDIAKNGAQDSIDLLGKALPASIVSINGAIAKVKFEVLSEYNLPQIEVPVAMSEYVREPLKKGDKGILIPCGASVFAVSGQNENTADLSTPSNLSSLVFFPIGNKSWKAVDKDMLVLTGIKDVLLRDDSHQLQLEDVNTAWLSLIQQINTLLGIIGPLLTTPQTLTQITADTNPVKPRA